MKKVSIYGLTAAAVFTMAGVLPVTAYGAVGTYGIYGGMGKVKVISGGELNCQTDFSGIRIPGFSQPEDTTEQTAYVKRVAELVNEERAKAGFSPLAVNTQAMNAADVRAGEIASNFSHSRPDGSSFSTALTEAGVKYRASGENIAYGQRTPEEVMAGWMNSEGHRANILNPDFTSIGIGHYQNDAGVNYWVQLFVG